MDDGAHNTRAADLDACSRLIGELSSEEAKRISGADAVIDAHDFEAELRQLAKRHTVVYEVNDRTDYGFMLNPASRDLSKVLQRIFPSVQSCLRQLRELRAIKQPEEIAALRQAIALTIEAFEVAKQRLPDCQHEYECEAEFDYLSDVTMLVMRIVQLSLVVLTPALCTIAIIAGPRCC